MSAKYNETYEVIIAMAKAKMIMNAHKGEIENVDRDVLMSLGKGEFEELAVAVTEDENYIHIIEEAADVLNYVVGIVHNTIKDYRTRK